MTIYKFILAATCFVLLFISYEKVLGQELTTDSVTVNKAGSKHALYAGVGFGSNMLFSGVSLSGNQPYLSTDLLYSYNKNWMVSAIFYNLPGVDPALAFYDLSIAYRKTFNSHLDAGITLSRYSTASSLQDQYFGNFTYLSVSAGLDWRILYTKAVFSTMLEQDGASYLQIKNSHYFSTPDFFKGKAFFSFDPSVNMVFGDRYQTDEITTQVGGGNNQTPVNSTLYKSSFGLLDMEFSIPVALNIGRATFEMEPLYYLPIHKDPDFPANKGMFFFLNLYFKIL